MDNNEKGSKKGNNGKKNSGRPRGASRVRRAAIDIIIVCLAVVCVFSGWKIWSILHEYHKNQGIYDELAGTAHAGGSSDGAAWVVDFDALRSINPDIVAWIRYEGTPIDYPIVHGSDNEKYLTTLFEGSYGGCGTLFVEAATERPFGQFNTIVYGHHMRDGSMFASLEDLRDPQYSEDHPEMQLCTPDGRFRLQIWAFLNQPADSDFYITNITAEEDRQAYLDLIRSSAEYLTAVDDTVSTSDRIVVLSTCAYEYEDARYLVACRMQPVT